MNEAELYYVSEKEIETRYTDGDFRDELKPSALMSLFLEMAGVSADKLGFGYTRLLPQGQSFVITNLYCELERPIHIPAKLALSTWPIQPRRAIFLRDFKVSAGEELLARATSRWCLLDLKSGSILPVSTLSEQDYAAYPAEHCLDCAQWKIPLVAASDEAAFSIRIRNSEYDHNLHVNNTRYADYCFNVFTIAELEGYELKAFRISFLKQCREEDELKFYRKEIGTGEFLVTGYCKGEAVVAAKIEWRQR